MRTILEYIKQHKRLSIAVVIVIGVPGLAVAWWLGSPLFLDKTVDEEFPLAANAVVPENMTMPDAESTMVAAADVETSISEEMMEAMGEMLAPEHVKSGDFRDADSFHQGSGTATIWNLGTDGFALRFEDFNVINGPDLRVLLSTHPDPMSRSELQDSGYTELGKLKGNIGNQNYLIPPDLDVNAQQSVVIYCKPFHVLFAVAPLSTQ